MAAAKGRDGPFTGRARSGKDPVTRVVLAASVARNRSIGRAGQLLWDEPLDKRHFRRVTMAGPVVMGRKTWDSLPARFRPLPGRRNVVVTRNRAWHAEGAEAVPSLDAALALLADAPVVFVIGGGELYEAALPRADVLEMTEIDAELEGDTYFPPWRDDFEEVARESHTDARGVPFAFVTYRRRRRAA